MTTLAALALVGRGEHDLDATVARCFRDPSDLLDNHPFVPEDDTQYPDLRREGPVAETPPSLLHRLRANPGDRDAWEHFDALYRPLLSSWLQRHGLQDHDRDDLVQEILTAVVREMPRFQYDPEKGRFRDWLRQVVVNRLRGFWRQRQARPRATGDDGFQVRVLEQLADHRGDLARQWDQEHDLYVVRRFLEMVRGDFAPTTWLAFERLLAGALPAAVAAELGMSVNAVYLARAGILQRLREEMAGLVG
jgi:RNA polymerase sigma-70 factor (ECF subfamily)